MRILLVSSYLPYPLHDGGRVRLYNIMKELSKHHKITLVCEKRSYQTEEDIAEVEKFCEQVVTVNRKKQWSLKNIMKTGISSSPFLLTGHTLPAMKEKLVRILREKQFDVIHIETFYVMQNLPKTYLPTILVEHNIEYQVYMRYTKTAPLAIRPLLLADIWKMRRWEESFWRQATKVVAVSEPDKKIIEQVVPAIVAPNGVDLKQFPFGKKIKQKEQRILFMGDFKWIQNQLAAEWIVREIWPEILQQLTRKKYEQQVKLWIVGKHIPERLKLLGDKTIFFDEHAPDDTAKIYQSAAVLLAPLKVGGGTSYKILESMSSGLPVVTTELGVKGLGAKNKKEALVGETTESLAEHVVTVLTNEKVREHITKNAHSLIEKEYTWESITKKLENVYNTVYLAEKEKLKRLEV